LPAAGLGITWGGITNSPQEISGPKTLRDITTFKDTVKILNKETLQFFDLDNSNYVQFRAPTDITETYTFTWPSVAPQDGQEMRYSSGAGRFNFVTPYSGVAANEVDSTKIKD